MNPFLVGVSKETKSMASELPLFVEYAYDFEHDRIMTNVDGTTKKVSGNDALKVWIYKALKTERARYEAYKHGIYNNDCPYGVELEQFIGKRANDSKAATQIKTYIRDGLMVNPYIKSIDSIEIKERTHDRLGYEIAFTSIYGVDKVVI